MEETRGARCKLLVREPGTPKARQEEKEGDSKINLPMASDHSPAFVARGFSETSHRPAGLRSSPRAVNSNLPDTPSLIVPTPCVGMHPVTLCVTSQKRNAERPWRHSHAGAWERSNKSPFSKSPRHNEVIGPPAWLIRKASL